MAKKPGEVQCEHCQTVFAASSSGLLLSLHCPSCGRPTSATSVGSSVRDGAVCAYCLNPSPVLEPTSFTWTDDSRGKYGAIMRANDLPRCGSCKRVMRTKAIVSVLLALAFTSSVAFYFGFPDRLMERVFFVLLLTPVLGFGVSQLASFPQRSNAKQWLGLE